MKARARIRDIITHFILTFLIVGILLYWMDGCIQLTAPDIVRMVGVFFCVYIIHYSLIEG